jgi:hypothetical protein
MVQYALSSPIREMVHAFRRSLMGRTSPACNTCSTLRGARAFTQLLFAQRQPMLRATVCELPLMVLLTQESLAHHSAQARVTPCPGNYFHDNFTGGNDLIVLSNALQTEAVNMCRIS